MDNATSWNVVLEHFTRSHRCCCAAGFVIVTSWTVLRRQKLAGVQFLYLLMVVIKKLAWAAINIKTTTTSYLRIDVLSPDMLLLTAVIEVVLDLFLRFVFALADLSAVIILSLSLSGVFEELAVQHLLVMLIKVRQQVIRLYERFALGPHFFQVTGHVLRLNFGTLSDLFTISLHFLG